MSRRKISSRPGCARVTDSSGMSVARRSSRKRCSRAWSASRGTTRVVDESASTHAPAGIFPAKAAFSSPPARTSNRSSANLDSSSDVGKSAMIEPSLITAMDVLRTVVVYAHGYALVEACFLGCAVCGPWPDDELSQMRRVSQMVPRDAPDHLVRLAMLFCGRCDMEEQFALGIDLMIRGLDATSGEPGC